MSKPHIGNQEYELGQVVSIVYHANYKEPALFEGKARIISWNEATEEIGFEIVDGPVGGTFVSTQKPER